MNNGILLANQGNARQLNWTQSKKMTRQIYLSSILFLAYAIKRYWFKTINGIQYIFSKVLYNIFQYKLNSVVFIRMYNLISNGIWSQIYFQCMIKCKRCVHCKLIFYRNFNLCDFDTIQHVKEAATYHLKLMFRSQLLLQKSIEKVVIFTSIFTWL